MQDKAPHADVAERFRYFLEVTELSREQFATAVDGAVTPRSLYSFLSGRRRPSRALAVLIERQWGYRADYLLEGKGVMLVSPAKRALTLSEEEGAVLAFMGESVENARTLRRDLDDAALWTRLWSRTNAMLDDLESVSSLSYPFAVRRAFQECIDVAERFAELKAKRHSRRVHHLATAFISRFLSTVGVAPLLKARADAEILLEAEGNQLRERLEARADSASPSLEIDDTELRNAVGVLQDIVGDGENATALKVLMDRALVVDLDEVLKEIATG